MFSIRFSSLQRRMKCRRNSALVISFIFCISMLSPIHSRTYQLSCILLRSQLSVGKGNFTSVPFPCSEIGNAFPEGIAQYANCLIIAPGMICWSSLRWIGAHCSTCPKVCTGEMKFLEEAASMAKACTIGILITGLPSAPEQEATGWNLLDLLVLAFTLASGCKMSSHLFAVHQSFSADLVVFLHVKCRETAGIMNPLKATCVGDVFDFICARTQTHVYFY